ncbi:MAG: aminoacyl-tRNA hydrolase [Bacilli bacterium]|nr:aminoacyl-tRNA hydrolase [Bacilli bacterium]
MKLIVGLGNPGKEYEHTRHNMGFDALDKLAYVLSADFDRSGFKGRYALVKNPSLPEPVILLKPETYMNLSGESVRAISDYFKIPLEDIVICYDDMAIEVGKIRLRPSGSSGSHNGMKNIILHMGSEKIKRVRIGIGEPMHSGVDYVLGKPSKEEQEKLDESTTLASKAIRDYLLKGWDYAMNHYNV